MYFQLEDLVHFPPPNYVNPETRGHGLTILNSIFLALAAIFVALRIFSRLFVREWFGLDDVLILLGFISTVTLNAITFDGYLNHMWGRHLQDIPLPIAQNALKMAWFSKVLYLVCGMFIAFGLLAFYYRLIAKACPRYFRLALHITLVFNIIYWVSMIVAEINICRPVSYYWTFPGPPGAKCFREGPLTLAKGVIKVFIDLWITTLPIPWVLQTQMRRRQRYLVAVLFALGYVVTAAGAARVYYTWKLFFTNGDLSWWLFPTLISSTIENNLAIICACAPTIRPLFPHLFGGPVGRSVTRLRGWISYPRMSPNNSNGTEMSDKTQLPTIIIADDAPCKPSPVLSSSWCGSQADDVELVIQKQDGDQEFGEKHRGNWSGPRPSQHQSEVAARNDSRVEQCPPPMMGSNNPWQEHCAYETTNRSHGQIAVNVSEVSVIQPAVHPFDPRLDAVPRRGSWFDSDARRSFRSEQTLRDDVSPTMARRERSMDR